MATCTSCNGTGDVEGLVRIRDIGCRWRQWACRDCDGTGQVRAEVAIWKELGAKLRARRKEAFRSMGDMARELEVSVVEVSDWERGKTEAPDYVILAYRDLSIEESGDANKSMAG